MSAAKPVGVLLGLGAQVGEIDVAVVVAAHHDDIHAGHMRRRRIGAVRGGGNQADGAMALAAAAMIGADGQQSGVFALRAGIRLQRNRVIAR